MSSTNKARKGRFHRQDPVLTGTRTSARIEETDDTVEQNDADSPELGDPPTLRDANRVVDGSVKSTGINIRKSTTQRRSALVAEQSGSEHNENNNPAPVTTLPTRNIVRHGNVSTPSMGIKKAIAKSDPRRRSNRIGEVLVELGQLTPTQVRQILRSQRAGELEPFGRIARQLGFSSNKDVKRALAIQQHRTGPLNPQTCWDNKAISTLNDRQSASAEAIRTVRARLMINQDDETSRPIAIVSPEHGEGRSYIASNLAVSYAQAGRRTLLIDADLRSPTQHQIFGISNERGFSTLATNRNKDTDQHPVFNVIDNLFLVPAGPTTSSPQELLCRDYTGEWLNVIMRFFDVVILDTPAANHFADAELLASWAGHAIMVTRKHKSRKNDVNDLIGRMKSSETHIRGIVINE